MLLIDLLTGKPASGGGAEAAERRRAAAEAAASGDLELLSSRMDPRLFSDPASLPLPAHSVAAVAEAAAGCLATDPRKRPSAAAVASYLKKALNAAANAPSSASASAAPLSHPVAVASLVPAPAASPPLLPGFPGAAEALPRGGGSSGNANATHNQIPDLLSAPPPPLVPPAPAAPRSAPPASFNPFD